MYIPSYKEEPFEWYKEMRSENPIVRSGNAVYLFKNNDIVKILSDYRNFSSQFRDLLGSEMINLMNTKTSPSILILDPPRHTELRNLVSDAFTPMIINSYEDKIRKIASDLVDNIRKNDRVDIVNELSTPLPIAVISEMLGVPEKDFSLLKEWSDKLATSLGREPDIKTQYEMADYFYQMIDRKHNRDNIISRLSSVELDGKKLTDQDIAGFSILLLVAGNETTTNLITNMILSISENMDIYNNIIKNPSIISSVVEETLRFRSPVQSTRRYSKIDTEINGIPVYKNDFLVLYLGSANRDEDIYKKPEVFDPYREHKRHIAFGNGIHFCLGAPLARLEARIAIEELSRKVRSFEIENPSPDNRLDSDIMYGFNKLYMKIHD